MKTRPNIKYVELAHDTSSDSDDERESDSNDPYKFHAKNPDSTNTSNDTVILEHILDFIKSTKEERAFPCVSYDELIAKLVAKPSTKNRDKLLCDIRTLQSLDDENYVEDESEMDEELTTISWLKVPPPGIKKNIKKEVCNLSDESCNVSSEEEMENEVEQLHLDDTKVQSGIRVQPRTLISASIEHDDEGSQYSESVTVPRIKPHRTLLRKINAAKLNANEVHLNTGEANDIKESNEVSIFFSGGEDGEIEDEDINLEMDEDASDHESNVDVVVVDLEPKGDESVSGSSDVEPECPQRSGDNTMVRIVQDEMEDVVDVDDASLHESDKNSSYDDDDGDDDDGSEPQEIIETKSTKEKKQKKLFTRIRKFSSSSDEEEDDIIGAKHSSYLDDRSLRKNMRRSDNCSPSEVIEVLDVSPQQSREIADSQTSRISSDGLFTSQSMPDSELDLPWSSQGNEADLQEPASSSSQNPLIVNMDNSLSSHMANLSRCPKCLTGNFSSRAKKLAIRSPSNCTLANSDVCHLCMKPFANTGDQSFLTSPPISLSSGSLVESSPEASRHSRKQKHKFKAPVDSVSSDSECKQVIEEGQEQDLSDYDELTDKQRKHKKTSLRSKLRSTAFILPSTNQTKRQGVIQDSHYSSDSDEESVQGSTASRKRVETPRHVEDRTLSRENRKTTSKSGESQQAAQVTSDSDVESMKDTLKKRGRSSKLGSTETYSEGNQATAIDFDIKQVDDSPRKRGRPPNQIGSQSRSSLMIGPRSSRKSGIHKKPAEKQPSKRLRSDQDILQYFRSRAQCSDSIIEQLSLQAIVKLERVSVDTVVNDSVKKHPESDSPSVKKPLKSKQNREPLSESSDEFLILSPKIPKKQHGSKSNRELADQLKNKYEGQRSTSMLTMEDDELTVISISNQVMASISKSAVDCNSLSQEVSVKKPKHSKQSRELSESGEETCRLPSMTKMRQSDKEKYGENKTKKKHGDRDMLNQDFAEQPLSKTRKTTAQNTVASKALSKTIKLMKLHSPSQSMAPSESEDERLQHQSTSKNAKAAMSVGPLDSISRPTSSAEKQGEYDGVTEMVESPTIKVQQSTKKKILCQMKSDVSDRQQSRKKHRKHQALKESLSEEPPTYIEETNLPLTNKRKINEMSDSSVSSVSSTSRFSRKKQFKTTQTGESSKSKKGPSSSIQSDDMSDSSLYFTPMSPQLNPNLDEGGNSSTIILGQDQNRISSFPKKKLLSCVETLFPSEPKSSPIKMQLLRPTSVVLNKI